MIYISKNYIYISKIFFLGKQINLEVLNNLNSDDINLLIPESQFGKRIIFRTRLFDWRNRNVIYLIFIYF